MRIVVWNCQMAFRRKFHTLTQLRPDLLVISESESPAFLAARKVHLPWPNHVWIGDNPAKGLSVFAPAQIGLKLRRIYDPKHRFIAPVRARFPSGQLDLFALWTQAEKRQRDSYIAHSLNAFGPYLRHLRTNALILGDFNSSPVFKGNGKRHDELVARLSKRRFSSLYHRLKGHAHGQEPDATFWLHRDPAKPYHLDYIFAHETVAPTGLTIGAPQDWLGHSDHAPLILDLDAPRFSCV